MANRRDDVTCALLFDLDGTLVDSDGEHLVAFQQVFAPYGTTLDRATYTAEIMGAERASLLIQDEKSGHLEIKAIIGARGEPADDEPQRRSQQSSRL